MKVRDKTSGNIGFCSCVEKGMVEVVYSGRPAEPGVASDFDVFLEAKLGWFDLRGAIHDKLVVVDLADGGMQEAKP